VFALAYWALPGAAAAAAADQMHQTLLAAAAAADDDDDVHNDAPAADADAPAAVTVALSPDQAAFSSHFVL